MKSDRPLSDECCVNALKTVVSSIAKYLKLVFTAPIKIVHVGNAITQVKYTLAIAQDKRICSFLSM
jgi:hypothetical protein